MGYYDDHVDPSRQRESKDSKRTGIYALLSGILGALIVVFSLPFLANSGLLPYEILPQGEQEASNQEEGLFNEEIAETSNPAVGVSVSSEVTEAVERVSDAVVGVVNVRAVPDSFFGPGQEGEGTGSGVVYKKQGDSAYIVTNQHVIQGASEIDITLGDGNRIPAELIGEDELTDLAVLQVEADKVDTVADFGDSDSLQVGEPAIAIGNPLAFEGTVTLGIISALERSIPIDLSGNGQADWNSEVLQTDAAINPGNSGGALVNITGEVVGINSMKIAQQAVEGIGFAIPTSVALPVIEDLENYGEVQRPQLGVLIRSLNELPSFHWQSTLQLPEDVEGGVYLEGVEPNSPADRADLTEGDVIVEMNDIEIRDTHDLRKFLYTEAVIGDTIDIHYYRNGEQQSTQVTLEQTSM
ncbi:S1C family serine protease [Texcoconibacillus texcoconensis]|uniref:Serine protease Do n=1 Tax=Texcoconibacillus texcoconensis TaxID=1095777 RepID=A0A840QTZ0_9BACI|nr:trypsin-like peptidase domain-containing protein [Texcoconibacillus texcoconensis]MBB5174751.1 serine protease Do [Texcoconibacillus texcoconensis]